MADTGPGGEQFERQNAALPKNTDNRDKPSFQRKAEKIVEESLRGMALLEKGEYTEAFSRQETFEGKQILTMEDLSALTDIVKKLKENIPLDPLFNFEQAAGAKAARISEQFAASKQEVLTDSGKRLEAVLDEGKLAREMYDLTVEVLAKAAIRNKVEREIMSEPDDEERIDIIRNMDSNIWSDGEFLRKMLYLYEGSEVANAILERLPAHIDISMEDLNGIAPQYLLAVMPRCTVSGQPALHLYTRLARRLIQAGEKEDRIADAFTKMIFIIENRVSWENDGFGRLPQGIQEALQLHFMNDIEIQFLTEKNMPADRKDWEDFVASIDTMSAESGAKLVVLLAEFPDLQKQALSKSPLGKLVKTPEQIEYALKLIETNCRINEEGNLIWEDFRYVRDILTIRPYAPEYGDKLVKLYKQKALDEFDRVLFAARSAALEKIPPKAAEEMTFLIEYPDKIMNMLLEKYEREHAHGVIAFCEKLPIQMLGLALSGEIPGNIFFTAPYEACAKKCGGKDKLYETVRPLVSAAGHLPYLLANMSSRGRLGEIIPGSEKGKQVFVKDVLAVVEKDDLFYGSRLLAGINRALADSHIGPELQEKLLAIYTAEKKSEKKSLMGFAVLKTWNTFAPEIQRQHAKTIDSIQKEYGDELKELEKPSTDEWLADGKITVAKVFTPGKIMDYMENIQALLPEDKREEAARIIMSKKSFKAALSDPLFADLKPEIKKSYMDGNTDAAIRGDLEHQEGYMGASIQELLNDGYEIIEGEFKVINAKRGVYKTSDRVVLRKTINGIPNEMVCIKSFNPTKDIGAQLADSGVDIVELRAHCWDMDEAFMATVNKPSHQKAVVIGACNGFNNVDTILTKYIDGPLPQFMGTVGEGYGPINQALTNALLEAVTSKQFSTWSEIGQYIRDKLVEKFTSSEDQKRLAQYVLPGEFSSLLVHLKGYEAQQERESQPVLTVASSPEPAHVEVGGEEI